MEENEKTSEQELLDMVRSLCKPNYDLFKPLIDKSFDSDKLRRVLDRGLVESTHGIMFVQMYREKRGDDVFLKQIFLSLKELVEHWDDDAYMLKFLLGERMAYYKINEEVERQLSG